MTRPIPLRYSRGLINAKLTICPQFAISAAFVPSILHRLKLTMLTVDLRSTLFVPVGIKSMHLVQTVITRSNAPNLKTMKDWNS